ncbi:MAG TPA: hypothetical protein VHY48_01400 [Acidobacteriaceae bacterium]|nr:hypothetical protein [Acidobacteriaceae bacterium]
MSDFETSDDRVLTEKFAAADVMALRGELLQSGLDSFQAAEIVANFLSGRGYGISSQEARHVASKIEGLGCKPEHIQAELERVARVM